MASPRELPNSTPKTLSETVTQALETLSTKKDVLKQLMLDACADANDKHPAQLVAAALLSKLDQKFAAVMNGDFKTRAAVIDQFNPMASPEQMKLETQAYVLSGNANAILAKLNLSAENFDVEAFFESTRWGKQNISKKKRALFIQLINVFQALALEAFALKHIGLTSADAGLKLRIEQTLETEKNAREVRLKQFQQQFLDLAIADSVAKANEPEAMYQAVKTQIEEAPALATSLSDIFYRETPRFAQYDGIIGADIDRDIDHYQESIRRFEQAIAEEQLSAENKAKAEVKLSQMYAEIQAKITAWRQTKSKTARAQQLANQVKADLATQRLPTDLLRRPLIARDELVVIKDLQNKIRTIEALKTQVLSKLKYQGRGYAALVKIREKISDVFAKHLTPELREKVVTEKREAADLYCKMVGARVSATAALMQCCNAQSTTSNELWAALVQFLRQELDGSNIVTVFKPQSDVEIAKNGDIFTHLASSSLPKAGDENDRITHYLKEEHLNDAINAFIMGGMDYALEQMRRLIHSSDERIMQAHNQYAQEQLRLELQRLEAKARAYNSDTRLSQLRHKLGDSRFVNQASAVVADDVARVQLVGRRSPNIRQPSPREQVVAPDVMPRRQGPEPTSDSRVATSHPGFFQRHPTVKKVLIGAAIGFGVALVLGLVGLAIFASGPVGGGIVVGAIVTTVAKFGIGGAIALGVGLVSGLIGVGASTGGLISAIQDRNSLEMERLEPDQEQGLPAAVVDDSAPPPSSTAVIGAAIPIVPANNNHAAAVSQLPVIHRDPVIDEFSIELAKHVLMRNGIEPIANMTEQQAQEIILANKHQKWMRDTVYQLYSDAKFIFRITNHDQFKGTYLEPIIRAALQLEQSPLSPVAASPRSP